MSHLELIIPFGIPPASLAKDLLKEIHTPALANLIASAGTPRVQIIDVFSRALSHEYWQAGQFPPPDNANSPAITWDLMRIFGQTPDSGYWFTFQPVHIHIARDHLVLTDQRRLDIHEEDSRALFDIAATSCSEAGLTLLYGDTVTWFLRADAWSGLQTATVDAACGHNIDIWMPTGEFARAWRKLQNEIQMLWYAHDINIQREMQGKKTVNSVWISGGAQGVNASRQQCKTASSLAIYDSDAAGNAQKTPILLDTLSEAALNNDWGQWLESMHDLDKHWFAPLTSALKNKQISSLTLHFSDPQKFATFELTPWSLRKFWIKSSLHHLFSIS